MKRKVRQYTRCEPGKGKGEADGEESAVANGFFKERSEFKKSLVSVESVERLCEVRRQTGVHEAVADEDGRGENNQSSRERARISGTMPIIHSEVATRCKELKQKAVHLAIKSGSV